MLCRVNTHCNTRDAWVMVCEVTKGRARHDCGGVDRITFQVLNKHYATTSTEYWVVAVKLTALDQKCYITEYEVVLILDHLKPTATGLDGLVSMA